MSTRFCIIVETSDEQTHKVVYNHVGSHTLITGCNVSHAHTHTRTHTHPVGYRGLIFRNKVFQWQIDHECRHDLFQVSVVLPCRTEARCTVSCVLPTVLLVTRESVSNTLPPSTLFLQKLLAAVLKHEISEGTFQDF